MTISTTIRKAGPFTGNGVTIAFPFAFKVFAAADVVVTEAVIATGVETVKTLTTDYTVALNADQNASPGGTVNYLVAPAASRKLVITSNVAATQSVQVTNLGGFYPEVFNNEFDKLTVLVQQLDERVARSLTLAVTATPASAAITASASGILRWNPSADAIVTISAASLAAEVAPLVTPYALLLAGTGTDKVAGVGDANLLVFDRANDQVSIGSAPVAGYRKLYVQLTSADMTVAGTTIGHAAIEARMDATGSGAAAIHPDGIYGTLWYHPLANAAFTGTGAAVKGNAYTIDRAGITCDVTNLVGVYGRARHESALGTVTNAIALYADAAQKAGGAGTVTNTFALYVNPSAIGGAKNYGVYFTSAPADGALAAADNVNLAIKAGGTGKAGLFSAVGSVEVQNTGETAVASTTSGGIHLGTWGELVELGAGAAGVLTNAYSDRTGGGFKYRNTNATYGAAGVLGQYFAPQTVSLVAALPGAAGAAAGMGEILRATLLMTNTTGLSIRVDRASVKSLDEVSYGAADSGGAGFRLLRIPN